MTKNFHILLWIPLIYATLFFVYWVQIYMNEVISFEEYVLEKQSNYAAESAVLELLVDSDLDLDYNEPGAITLEPELAVNDFAHTMCINYGYIPTEQNLTLVKNDNIRTLVVASYDGMYAYYPMQTETHAYELKQTPKIPYFYTSADGTQYCLTLNPDMGYWGKMESGTFKMHQFDKYENKPSEDIQATAINEQVADIVNWALYESYSAGKSDMRIELPAISETVRGQQPVKTPTVIAVVDGNLQSYATSITAECIGGAQLEEIDYVVGYTLKGASNTNGLSGKFYAYSSWWKKHESWISDPTVADSGVYFDSAFDAAKVGYNDLNLIE